MKVLDRYLIRELITPVIYASCSLVFLILIADLFDNLDQFLRYKTPFTVILRYYASLIPFSFIQIIPWATWLGALFLLVNFGMHNEILAMKVAGLKITTIIRPIVFTGFLIGIFTFLISDRIVPWSYHEASQLRDIYIDKKTLESEGKILKSVTFNAPNDKLYYFRELLLEKQKARNIIVLWLDQNTKKTKQKISAKSGEWKDGVWEFENVIEHKIDSRGKILGEPRTYPFKSYRELTATPEHLANASRESIFLTYREMKDAMIQLKETGVDIYSEMVDLQNRLASPWHSLIMIMITIPLLAPTRTRKGIAVYVLICVGLIFVFQFMGAIFMALGKSGIVFPFLSAWAASIIFAVGSLVYLDRSNY